MFSNFDSLAFNNPYYINKNGISVFNSFDKVINESEDSKLDPVAIIEMLSKGYCFGDRTLIKNIKRTPWMAKPTENMKEWEFYNLPSHGSKNQNEEDIADNLYLLLQNEIETYCQGKNNIGILLTGGMDSRITAGILNNLKLNGKISTNITALTWGIENSRDVIYSKEIANSFEWNWEHINLSSNNLLENININSEIGCEVSPIHLHAISRVRSFNNLDCIIASSFGDSIGRAVYSGSHISQLSNNKKYIKNWFFLLNKDFYQNNKATAFRDLENYRLNYHRNTESQYLEIEQQAHYMRRMLNPCIGIINKNIPTYQSFSSPEVYGYMWSINSDRRNNKIYSILINKHIKNLINIPWSKTGISYNKQTGIPDKYLKNYHLYHSWINNELFDFLMSELNSTVFDNLTMFNKRAFYNAVQANQKLTKEKLTRVDEILVWSVSLANMIKKFNIDVGFEKSLTSHFDTFNSYLTKPYLHLFEQGLSFKKLFK